LSKNNHINQSTDIKDCDETSCFHCALPANGSAACYGDVAGQPHRFCCSGCLSVCQVIHEAGLDGFYQRLKKREATIAPPPDAPNDMDQYDLLEVQNDFVQVLADGSRQTQLMVEGIHCAACVWLIEKALMGMAGVIKAEVNLVHHRLLLQWQPEQLSLVKVMQRLAALGYAAVPFNLDSVEGNMREQHRRILFRLGFAAFGAMNMMWISIALYAGAFSGISQEYRHFFHWISFAIATPVLLYSGGPILRSAWQGLRQGQLGMDLPIAIGALATFSYSVWQLFHAGEHVYFDTVVTFLFVILIGRYLEAMARGNASSATLRLLELQPRMATRIIKDGEERVSVRKLNIGDYLRIKAGDKVPADGVVIEGESYLDESMMSGESRPIHKYIGSKLVGGTVNGESHLVMQVEQTGSATILSRIIHLVESAQGSKARIQHLADRIVPYFVATTLALSGMTFLYWFHVDMDTALLAATAVLIITCPCALGLATPMAIAVSTGLAAKWGVLVRNGEALEGIAKVSHVVMDKTGTLTEGHMSVATIVSDSNHDRLLELSAAVERHYSHPVALAISASVVTKELTFFECQDLQFKPGLGVGGRVVLGDANDCEVWVGNQRLMQQLGISIEASYQSHCEAIESAMGIAILIAVDGKLLGLLHLEDCLRQGVHELVNYFEKSGLGLTVLTGDSVAAAHALEKSLCGASAMKIRVLAEVSPEDKAREIATLQQEGEYVLMVGDGVNDAPALSQANISIAMGTGTDVSMECSDIVLMKGELRRIPWVLQLGNRMLQTIRQNLTLSLAYNIVLVPVAMAAWLTPVFAALAMPLSSLLVIGNAILIRRHMRHI